MPVLTSSTESFRSGLTTYAQLQAPRNNSPQKATKVHVSCAPLAASWHAAPAVFNGVPASWLTGGSIHSANLIHCWRYCKTSFTLWHKLHNRVRTTENEQCMTVGIQAVSEHTGRKRSNGPEISPRDADCVDRAYAKISSQ